MSPWIHEIISSEPVFLLQRVLDDKQDDWIDDLSVKFCHWSRTTVFGYFLRKFNPDMWYIHLISVWFEIPSSMSYKIWVVRPPGQQCEPIYWSQEYSSINILRHATNDVNYFRIPTHEVSFSSVTPSMEACIHAVSILPHLAFGLQYRIHVSRKVGLVKETSKARGLK